MKLGKVKNREIFKRVLILLVCIYMGWFLKSRLTPPPAGMGAMGAMTPYVTGLQVEETDSIDPKSYVGSVEAINAVDLRPQITGYVEKVLFQEGSLVKEGDILFVIEQDRYLATVNLREAELKKAEAELVRAEKDYNRQKSLAKQQYASESKLDDSYALYLQSKAAVQQTKANLDLAKIDLGYTEVKAPFTGYIGKALVTEGNYVNSSSQILARIVQANPIRIAFSMPDKEFMSLKTKYDNTNDDNLFVKLTLPNGKFMEKKVEHRFSDNEVNNRTATVAVYAEIDNSEGLIQSGNYVKVSVNSNQTKKVIVIPQRALGQDENGSFVYVVNDENIAEQRHLVLGEAQSGKQEVLEGLKAGEKIIVNGLQKVKAGQKVNLDLAKIEEGK